MRVLVACEESQAVCKEFRRLGHEAFSCDLQECSGGHPEWHINGDARKLISPELKSFVTSDGATHEHTKWDLLIAHPPCTYLSNAGAARLYKRIGGKATAMSNGSTKDLTQRNFSLLFGTRKLKELQWKTQFRAAFIECRHTPRSFSPMNTGTNTAKKPACG